MAQARAWLNRRRTASAPLESRASAHHSRFAFTSRTTESVAWPFSGCSPARLKTKAATCRYAAATTWGACGRAARMVGERWQAASMASDDRRL